MSTPVADVRARVLDELRQGERFVLLTHEHPDGDALGSLLGMHGLLELLGKDSVAFIAPDELPLPHEYRDLDLSGVVTEPPADLQERTVVFLDCGNIDRNPSAQAFLFDGATVLNLDHHHDNTRFGTVDHVDDTASCTAEIVWELMVALDVEPTPGIAEVLYLGLVTDTGKFMYENTGPRAHVMAAALIEAGVDVHAVFRRLYEDVPDEKLRLLGRALSSVRRFDGGRLTYLRLTCEDFRATGAAESHSEGIVDHLRAVQGTRVAAFARQRDGEGTVKVSLRAADPAVDVSAIARAAGGGGHRQAAGFTTAMGDEDLVAFLRAQVAAQP